MRQCFLMTLKTLPSAAAVPGQQAGRGQRIQIFPKIQQFPIAEAAQQRSITVQPLALDVRGGFVKMRIPLRAANFIISQFG